MVLQRLWNLVPSSRLLELLPGRTWSAIYGRATGPKGRVGPRPFLENLTMAVRRTGYSRSALEGMLRRHSVQRFFLYSRQGKDRPALIAKARVNAVLREEWALENPEHAAKRLRTNATALRSLVRKILRKRHPGMDLKFIRLPPEYYDWIVRDRMEIVSRRHHLAAVARWNRRYAVSAGPNEASDPRGL